MPKRSDGMLDAASKHCGVFISDLRRPEHLRALTEFIRAAGDEYTLREWCDAVSYLTGQTRQYASAGEARSGFLAYAQSRRPPF